ncbi:MAG: hypothetical protein U0031_06210 [Thermomicrobiales bacterium]
MTADDFRSARALGVPRPETHVEEWERGISVYDNLSYAQRRAARNQTGLGRFVATLIVPDDGSVKCAKTFGPHHYTIYGEPEALLALVRGPVIAAGLFTGESGNGRIF